MAVCIRCKKGIQVLMNVSHSHVRTKTRSHPNLHLFKGKKYCTKCLRSIKAEVISVKKDQTVGKSL